MYVNTGSVSVSDSCVFSTTWHLTDTLHADTSGTQTGCILHLNFDNRHRPTARLMKFYDVYLSEDNIFLSVHNIYLSIDNL